MLTFTSGFDIGLKSLDSDLDLDLDLNSTFAFVIPFPLLLMQTEANFLSFVRMEISCVC